MRMKIMKDRGQEYLGTFRTNNGYNGHTVSEVLAYDMRTQELRAYASTGSYYQPCGYGYKFASADECLYYIERGWKGLDRYTKEPEPAV